MIEENPQLVYECSLIIGVLYLFGIPFLVFGIFDKEKIKINLI